MPGGRLRAEKLARLITTNRIHPEKLITHKFPLSQINEAHQTNLKMEGLKIAIVNE